MTLWLPPITVRLYLGGELRAVRRASAGGGETMRGRACDLSHLDSEHFPRSDSRGETANLRLCPEGEAYRHRLETLGWHRVKGPWYGQNRFYRDLTQPRMNFQRGR